MVQSFLNHIGPFAGEDFIGMEKIILTLITGVALCAPALAEENKPQPKGKRPVVSFGQRDIQAAPDNSMMKKPAPASTAAPAAKPAKKAGPTTKNY